MEFSRDRNAGYPDDGDDRWFEAEEAPDCYGPDSFDLYPGRAGLAAPAGAQGDVDDNLFFDHLSTEGVDDTGVSDVGGKGELRGVSGLSAAEQQALVGAMERYASGGQHYSVPVLICRPDGSQQLDTVQGYTRDVPPGTLAELGVMYDHVSVSTSAVSTAEGSRPYTVALAARRTATAEVELSTADGPVQVPVEGDETKSVTFTFHPTPGGGQRMVVDVGSHITAPRQGGDPILTADEDGRIREGLPVYLVDYTGRPFTHDEVRAIWAVMEGGAADQR